MRVLVTGSKGQLGKEIVKQLNSLNGFEVIETDHRKLDITDLKDVFVCVADQEPDIIINCAAYTNVDECEHNKGKAFQVNALGVRNLSVAAKKIDAAIMQVSTNYVFDGTNNSPILEYEAINPINFYGKSKALGEVLVRKTNPKHFIVRTAWLYGDGKNFVRTMLALAQKGTDINVVRDQIGSPTNTADLSKCIINLIKTEEYGTYHASCEGSCSLYDFANEIFRLKAIDIKVNEITSEDLVRPAKRPKYTVLDNYMLKTMGLNTFRTWEEALKDYLSS